MKIYSSLVEDVPAVDQVEVIQIPMNDVAMELGDARLVNMVAAGAYLEKTGVASLESLEQALRDILPERNHRLIPLNVKAMQQGAEYVRRAAAS